MKSNWQKEDGMEKWDSNEWTMINNGIKMIENPQIHTQLLVQTSRNSVECVSQHLQAELNVHKRALKRSLQR